MLPEKLETARQELVMELQQAAVTDSATHAQGDCEAYCSRLAAWSHAHQLDCEHLACSPPSTCPQLHSWMGQIDRGHVFAAAWALMHDLLSIVSWSIHAWLVYVPLDGYCSGTVFISFATLLASCHSA